MEDQFREAAERYDLPTDKAYNWDKVRNALTADGTGENKTRKQSRKRFVWWYMLLLPLGWLAHNAYNFSRDKVNIPEAANNNKIVNSPAAVTTPPIVEERQSFNVLAGNIIFFKKDAAAGRRVAESNVLWQPLTVIKYQPDSKRDLSPVTGNNLPGEGRRKDAVKETPGNAVTTTQIFNEEATPVQTVISTIQRKYGLYAGLVAGADINFVRFQRPSGIGLSFGISAGFAFNEHWAVETGVLSAQKKYYTRGEYFDKRGQADLYNTTLVSVDGHCRMTEIPLNVRYTFRSFQNASLSVAAGTSSYFMQEEYYDYAFVRDGQDMSSEESYHTPESKIFAAANVSVAYEHMLGSSFSLRVEPYAKFPLRNIGTGNLSISSTGINVSAIKYFR